MDRGEALLFSAADKLYTTDAQSGRLRTRRSTRALHEVSCLAIARWPAASSPR